MNLQASGGEGKVDLSWTQDDFDLLAGYNIYRATSLDGPYTRVNSTIIPKEETSFTDTSVAPAQTYFYTSASCSCPRAATTWPLSANRSSPPATAAAGMALALARVY
jgi:fibronectin type 3 domain-containing protein